MSTPGICPACEEPGAVAEPCRREACARRGRYCVPLEYAPRTDEAVDGYVGQKWGDYLIVRKLGAGGVGAVYLALQCPLLMETALKLFTDTSTGLGSRFESEASALARLRHPNIVRLLHYGVHGERPFLVMEYVPGGRTLGDLMKAGLSSADAFEIIRQTALGLESAHLVGIVHRDIKPANIMIQTLPGQPYYVRLVDFGLAKFVDTGTSTQMMAGTPTYMAPEQLTKRNIGPWTDWYALGAIAFELFTRRRPFTADSVKRKLLLKADPSFDPTLELANADLPPGIVAFLRRALAYDPRERPANAAAFVQELSEALAGLDSRGAAPIAPESRSFEESTSAEMQGAAEPPRATTAPRRRPAWVFPVGAVALGALLGVAFLALSPEPTPEPVSTLDGAAVTPALSGETQRAAEPDLGALEIEPIEVDSLVDASPFADAAIPDATPDTTPEPARPSRRGRGRKPVTTTLPEVSKPKPKPKPTFRTEGLSVPGMP